MATDIELIQSLRPVDNSAKAHQEALSKLRAKHAETVQNISFMRDDRAQLLLSGDKKQIQARDAELRAAQDLLSDLDAMLHAVTEGANLAARNERVEKLFADLGEIGYENDCEAFVEAFRHYSEAAKIIADMCEIERKALTKRHRVFSIVEKLKELDVEDEYLPDTSTPARRAGALMQISGFCEMVRLPGAKGAPELLKIVKEIENKRLVADCVYDETLRKTTQVGTKEIIEKATQVVNAVDDKPFWWAKDKY